MPLIGAALLACLSFPLVLLGLSRGPLRIRAPGRRFAVAWLALFFAWLVVAVALGRPALQDVLAVLFLFAAAVICSLMLWSVLCWGFTLNMLLVLLKLGRADSALAWELAYAGPNGILRLAEDRAGVLLGAGFAVTRDHGRKLELTPRGRLAASLAQFASWLFATQR